MNKINLSVFAVLSLTLSLAQADVVKSWDFSAVQDNRAGTKAIIEKIKESVNRECNSISANQDEVVVLSQTVTHQDIYFSSGDQYRQYPVLLQTSDIVLVRKANGKSYEIKAAVGWDYDLPMPQTDVILTSSQCSFKPAL